MLASFAWLRSLLPSLTASPSEVATRLTAAGLEVESSQAYGEAARSCVLAQVQAARPHPTKSGLKLVQIERGGSSLEVVCGAPNVPGPGALVVFAPLGAHLPAKGLTIERRTIAGVTSEGMLCSEAELGLTDEASGILVLPEKLAPPGTPLAKAIAESTDTVFSIGLTPNRPDGLGHIGLARELAALYALPFEVPRPAPPERGLPSPVAVSIDIQDFERCPHYGAAIVAEVHVGASPLWLRWRLSALGVRSISNVVDITNWVMLERGHPMHGFDLDRIRPGAHGEPTIVVRRANEGEALVTLDGVERRLSSDDLVICDGGGPVALAGVMGGANSEIRETTKRVLFECAYFEARGIRRAARRHGLHTESSHRFERGVDPGGVDSVLASAVRLSGELAGAAASPQTFHAKAASVPARTLKLRTGRVQAVAGTPVSDAESRTILERLGCQAIETAADGVVFSLPTHRPDLNREIDLVEEVIRVRGMDTIVAELPAIRPTRDQSAWEELTVRARRIAVELGLSEALTYAFVSPAELEAVRAPASTVILKNPLSETHSVMRTSLLPGLVSATRHARRHGQAEQRLFSIGRTYHAGVAGALPRERLGLAVVLAGHRPSYLSKPEPVDVFDAKGFVLEFVERLTGRRASVSLAGADRSEVTHLHPRGAALVRVDDDVVGVLGPLHPDVADACDLESGLLIVEIDLETLAARPSANRARYRPIPRFPTATRDLAIVVRDNVPVGEVEAAIRNVAGELAEDVSLFDRFVGGAIPAEHASLAFHVVYRAPDRTLTDVEVDGQHAKVVAEVGQRFGASLRSA